MSDNLVRFEDYREGSPLAAEPPDHLKQTGGDGTSGGMAPWDTAIQRLEDKLESRFLWLLGAFAAGFLALLTILLTQTSALGTKFDALGTQLSTADQRVAKIEGALTSPSIPRKQ